MKKSLILTIAAISAVSCLGLVSCGEVSSATSSISIGDYTSMSITNKADLTAEWKLGEADRQIKFSFAPEANVNTLLNAGALTIVSSNADNVSVIGTYISAKAVGSSTITATLGSLTDSFDVTVGPVKPIGKSTKTIEELIPIISAQTDKVVDNTNIYTVTGTAMNIVNSAYGNFDLYNDDFTKHLTVYGSTTTASALEIQKVLDVEATATFTNPKDFVYGTTIHDGDKFTMTVLAEKYGSTNEIMGIIDASTISLSTTRTTFTASVNTPENGTAALSKTEGIYIGEPITCTATPAEGYQVDSVKVNGAAVAADASDATKYVFNASNVNEVVVTFKEIPTVVSSIEVTETGLGIGSGYGNYTGTIDGVSWKADATGGYGDGIQMRYKDSVGSSFYNTTVLPKAIEKITFTFTAGKTPYDKTDILSLTFGNDGTTYGHEALLSTAVNTMTYTVTPDANTYTYVKVSHTTVSGTVYFSSVLIDYVVD